MTIRDIFSHLISWRWQLYCWAICLGFGLAVTDAKTRRNQV